MRPAVLLTIFTGVLVLLRLETLSLPPTWDASMSVWPAALEITHRGSVLEVLQLPSYSDGGPNTHTLSLVTLVTALLIEWGDPLFAIRSLHLINILGLATMGYLVAKVVARFRAPQVAVLAGLGTVTFPLMVGQSAYLYTEIGAAAFGLAGLVAALDRRSTRAVVLVLVAVMIKPLAIVFIPPLCFLRWRQGERGLGLLSPVLAGIGLIPALLVPQPSSQADDYLQGIWFSWGQSWFYLSRSPELLLLLTIPLIAALVLIRGRSDSETWDCFGASVLLCGSFVLFFLGNPLVTPGHFFIPRYFVMLVPVIVVTLTFVIGRTRSGVQRGILGLLVSLSVFLTIGPVPLGSKSPFPPVAERSLAFVQSFEEHRIGLALLADVGLAGVPVFHDHYAAYGYDYQEMLHYQGEFQGGTNVRPTASWVTLAEFPDRFAMLIEVPYLGGDKLFHVKQLAEADSSYRVEVDRFGSARGFPAEVVLIERVNTP